MKNELIAAEFELQKAETTSLFILQNNIKDSSIRVSKLE